ncbi:MND1-interacting protein 1-like [Salvia splendens]|uniref:MND1-interacting protein 1-like n=1 Tax=Salvia splendens TaxID=180675 RepID=UPI001C271C1F|nr:MND1-interacting protein 1-like [Salvia splendens]XP_042063812.1 MND1-interacting protein 1-like [Salvia splendens]XP_042063813.1 MND1-interacting protein 1-like [Salvia splendens]XP_042063814.1 MND1-interacting protein 1-like [Salvia splendens]XP_042063815.1 MND1-interacting protein 1-like [Salvia splendens]
MKELYRAMLQALLDNVLRTEPRLQRSDEMQRSDALWLLLTSKWGTVPSTSMPSHDLGGDNNNGCTSEKAPSELNIESSSKRVGILERINNTPGLASKIRQDIPILMASLQREMGTTFIKQQDLENAACEPIEGSHFIDASTLTLLEEVCVKWQENSPNDPKTAFIIDFIKSIRDLEEKVKVQKKWAQTKVIDSAKRLSKDLLELKMLKLDRVHSQGLKDKNLYAENAYSLLVMETEQTLRNMNCEASRVRELVRTLELSKAHIKADTEALRLSTSEYESDLNRVLHREMKLMKKVATFGKQITNLRVNITEAKQKVLQLQHDILQIEKEAKEAEDGWKQEGREKERKIALEGTEARRVEAHRAYLRQELTECRQNAENALRAKEDDLQRLEQELSRVQMFYQMSIVSLEGDTFLYNGVEVASLEKNAPSESSRHWTCMKCFTNDVSILFLPCAHQVLCAPCHEGSTSSSMGKQRCPFCGAEIEQSIKVYGPT